MSYLKKDKIDEVADTCVYHVNRSLLSWQTDNTMNIGNKKPINIVTIDALFRNWFIRALKSAGLNSECCNRIKAIVTFRVALDSLTKTVHSVTMVGNPDGYTGAPGVKQSLSSIGTSFNVMNYKEVSRLAIEHHNADMLKQHGVSNILQIPMPILDKPREAQANMPKTNFIIRDTKKSEVSSIVDYDLLNKTNFEKYVK